MRLGDNVLRQQPYTRTMYGKVKEFRKTASVLEVNKILKLYVVTKVRYQKYSTHSSTKFFKVRPHSITEVQQIFPTEWEARRRYCRWFQESVSNGFLDTELVSLSDEARFRLNGDVSSQNNKILCS
jgi:hypothetical protein